MRKDIIITANSKTSRVDLPTSRLGLNGENLQGNIIVKFDDEFVNGTAILEIQRNDEKYYLVMQKENESYYLPILSSLLSETTTIIMQIRITEGTDDESIPVWKSNKFYLKVEEAINAEIPIPEEYDEWIDIANAKLNELDNIDIDVNKVENTATVSITKKDGTTKSVQVFDGDKGDKGDKGEKGDTGSIGPQGPQGPQGIQGPMGPQGKAFTISKTYSSVSEMNADFDNMQVGDYVMIASSVELEDNAKLYVKGEEEWLFVSDFSGATGIQGERGPQGIQGVQGEQGIQGVQGEQGIQGIQGETGATGNGISTIQKTSTSGLVDTYTITYTDGNTSTFSITNGKDGEDGEVSQEQLDETNSHLDHLSKVSNLFEKITGTGTNITLNDTSDTMLKVGLNGNTTQNTTTGKNKFNPALLSQESGYNTYSNGKWTCPVSPNDMYNRSILYNAVGHKYDRDASKILVVKSNTAYTLKFYDATIIDSSLGYYTSNGTIINAVTFSNDLFTFTTPNGCERIDIRRTNSDQQLVFSKIMLVEGTYTSETMPDFEEYTGGQPAPSPSYPQTIHTINGDNEVKVEGKNLFSGWEKGKAIQSTDGAIIFNRNGAISDYIPVNFDTNPNYYVSGFTSTLSSFVSAYNSNKEFLGRTGGIVRTSIGLNSRSFIGGTPQGTGDIAYIMMCQYKQTSDSGTIDDIDNMQTQVEEGSTATEYEEHKEQTYPINLGDIEFCGIEDYQDVLFKNTLNSEYYDSSLELNKWYKLNRIGKKVLNGSENWYQWGTDTFYITKLSSVRTGLSNYFKYNSTATGASQLNNGEFFIHDNTNNNVVIFKNTSYTTVADFKTWLSTHNTTLYYVLETPTYTLLNDTLQTQLDNIQYALAYDTQTNISQTNNDLPFIIDAETYVDLADYVKNTDYASSSTGGVIKTGNYFQVNSSGQTYADTINYNAYQSVSNDTFISKGTLENVITGKGLIDSSYHDSTKQDIEDNTLTTINKTIPTAINEVNSIAKGANQALSYVNYSAMVTAFNSLTNNVYNVGQNVMIITLQVPDLWISGIESTSQTYTYTTDEAITTALSTNGYVQVGYYKLSALETQKVDLTDYATKTYVNNLFNSIVDGDEVSY